MALPPLSQTQINDLVIQVARHIEYHRSIYRQSAKPLENFQRTAMAPFFPNSALDSVRVMVLRRGRVSNPPFYPTLVRMGFDAALLPDFQEMAAITFVDTIVSRGLMSLRTMFHELVHVVQYEKLGVQEFAGKYVTGFLTAGSYEATPLERNAYDLEARFAIARASTLRVEDEVQKWVDGGLF